MFMVMTPFYGDDTILMIPGLEGRRAPVHDQEVEQMIDAGR